MGSPEAGTVPVPLTPDKRYLVSAACDRRCCDIKTTETTLLMPSAVVAGVAHSCLRGWRMAMEDEAVLELLSPALGCFAVLDGHGGHFCSRWGAEELPQRLQAVTAAVENAADGDEAACAPVPCPLVLKTCVMADARKATSNPHSVGVLFAVAGKAGFVLSEVLPAVAYLRTGLGIADAAERRRRNDLRGTSWALSFEVHLQEVMSPVIGFFDVVRSNLTSTAPSGSPTAHRVKAFKIQALCAAPFDVTIFLDLDSRPCRPDFASLLVDALGSADIALTNKYSTQSAVSSTSAVHWAGNESHNSACVVLNMRSPRTRALLQCYAAAFAAAVPLASRDQPSLSLALRSMALPSQLSSTHPSSSAQLTPKVVARLAVAAQKRYGTLRHVDLTSAVFCRKKLSPVVSCSAGCVLVHKPQKHDIGFKVSRSLFAGRGRRVYPHRTLPHTSVRRPHFAFRSSG